MRIFRREGDRHEKAARRFGDLRAGLDDGGRQLALSVLDAILNIETGQIDIA